MDTGNGRPENSEFPGPEIPQIDKDTDRSAFSDGDSNSASFQSVMDEKRENNDRKNWLWGMGCVGCGAFGCAGLVIMVAVALIFGAMWFEKNFFSSQPVEIPRAEMNEKERLVLDKKIYTLRNAMESRKGEVVSTSFTIDELNYFFQELSEKNKGKVHIKNNDGNSVTFEMSIPFEDKENRLFLNIAGEGKMEIDDFLLAVKLDRLKIGDYDVPEGDFIEKLSDRISEELLSSPEYSRLPYKLKKLKVDDGKVDLELKIK